MIQAARSGKQNIIEGSMASATSKETEIKLTNVARASLEELLADYRDFLRTRKLAIWDKGGLPIPSSALFTKPTLCWTSNCEVSKLPFSRKAVYESA